MSSGDAAPGGIALYLSLLPAPGGLAASLTDLRQTAHLGVLELSETALGRLRAWCVSAQAGGVSVADAGSASELGVQLGRELLPPSISSALRDVSSGTLTLQYAATLHWVPWEAIDLGDGACLGLKFALARRIVVDDAGRATTLPRHAPLQGALKVLLISGEPRNAGTETASARLSALLRGIPGLVASAFQAGDLPCAEVLRLMAANDVVHYVGPVVGGSAPCVSATWCRTGEALELGAIAALPMVPHLLISQRLAAPGDLEHPERALAAAACREGLNLLIYEADADGTRDFMPSLYSALARGTSAAEATRIAREVLLQDLEGFSSGLLRRRAELYGDPEALRSERRARHEDNQRQVTIMSVDLVESTRLLSVLGAERYSEILARYQAQCAQISRAHGGDPDDFQGDDGAMSYFGLRIAREDAAAEALRASLQLAEAVQALGLGVRIGVCTGQVVVRDGQPVGAAIHLAARLQAVAAPGTVVVGEATRRIVKDRFRFQPLELTASLKGFDGPQACHRLLGEVHPLAAMEQADTGMAPPPLTPLVGRHDELRKLSEHWSAVQAGTLRVVRLVGEAGIGKSRLVREFKSLLEVDGSGHGAVFESRCAPEHVHSAFRPLIESLRRELCVAAHEPPEAVLERLAALVSSFKGSDNLNGENGQSAIALLADLLGLTLPAPRHPVLAQEADWRRQHTVELMVELTCARVRRLGGCLIVEDIQWLDPSTAEFLDRLTAAARRLPLLILVTARTDAQIRWHPREVVYETELRGLSVGQAGALVQHVSGAKQFPADVVRQIAERSDGVPLFVEESARMVADLRAAGQAEGDTQAFPVPTTVLDLLTARLDRLGVAKQAAQVGGTLGREFPRALLEAVLAQPGAPVSNKNLDVHLGELVRAGMLLAKEDGNGTRFSFRHQLMRDAAYDSLLKRDRLRLHRLIAGVINERFPLLAGQQPELVALHYTEAGMDTEALQCWEEAVRQAASRSAHVEAIGHINSALAVLSRMPAGAEQTRQELRLQLLLAARLIATQGYGAERVEKVYLRARELAHRLGDNTAELRVLLGLEGYHFMRADFEQARRCVLDAAARAGSGASPIQRVQTQWALANIRMHQGDMEAAVREMDACRADYMRLEHRPAAVQDPGVMCLCYSAWSLWELGHPDEALRRVLDVVDHAERIRHQFSIGEAYGFRAAVLHFRGEDVAALESAEHAIRTCEESGFPVWLAHARVMRGRILSQLGEPGRGVEDMRQGYELWAGTGAVVTTPFYLTMRAEGLALDQRPDEGLALLEQALSIVKRTGERYYEAEILRLRGALLLQAAARTGEDRDHEAQDWFMQALESAQARRHGSLALRAAIDLGELLVRRGAGSAAIDLVDTALRAVVGGKGTRDVLRASALLAHLRGSPG